MRNLDFSSWQSIVTTVVGIALFALISIGIRLLMMFTVQQRQQRMNRQINERLKTLIAAYKTLGGSFTGDLSVDPAHLRDLKLRDTDNDGVPDDPRPGQERRLQIRDAVETALSDILLLGTEEQVRLAERAVRDMLAGKPVQTHALVVSLRNFIREALDLEPIPADLQVPSQGPLRPSSGSTGRSKGAGGGGDRAGGGGGMGGGGMGGGMDGGGMGGAGVTDDDQPSTKT